MGGVCRQADELDVILMAQVYHLQRNVGPEVVANQHLLVGVPPDVLEEAVLKPVGKNPPIKPATDRACVHRPLWPIFAPLLVGVLSLVDYIWRKKLPGS